MADFLFSASSRWWFRLCPRRWVHCLQHGSPPVKVTWEMRMGCILHAQRHRWFKDGIYPEHQAAQCGLLDLPPGGPHPSRVIASEVYFREPMQGVGFFTGRVDLIDMRDPYVVRVIDHKFTKRLRLCTPLDKDDELLLGPHGEQAILYSAWVLRKLAPSHTHVSFENHYSQFCGPEGSLWAGCIVSRERIESLWFEAHMEAESMAKLADGDPGLADAKSGDHCSACPLSLTCILSTVTLPPRALG